MAAKLYAPDGSYRVTLVNLEGDPVTFDFDMEGFATAEQLEDLLELVGTAEDTSADVTLIGLLKRVAEGVEALAE